MVENTRCPSIAATFILCCGTPAPREVVIGRVIKSYVNEDCLTNGVMDVGKVHPITWSRGPGDHLYHKLGDRLDHIEE